MQSSEVDRNVGDGGACSYACPDKERLIKAGRVMLEALNVRDNWEGNLTEAARRVNAAIAIAEKDVNPHG